MTRAGVPLETIQRFRSWQIRAFDHQAYDIDFIRGIIATERAIQETGQRETFLKEKIEELKEEEIFLTPAAEKQIQRLRDELEDLNKKYWFLEQDWYMHISSCKPGPLIRAFLAHRAQPQWFMNWRPAETVLVKEAAVVVNVDAVKNVYPGQAGHLATAQWNAPVALKHGGSSLPLRRQKR